MSRKSAVIIAGSVTTIVMVLVLGLGGFAARLNRPSSAASSNSPQGTATSAVCVNPSDVATLQNEIKDYQSALQQANAQLQAAYDEITRLQNQRRFGGESEQNEGGFFNPFDGD
jgi:uncharacterized protein HemX